MVAAPVLAAQGSPDARVFALIEEHGAAARLLRVADRRWRKAFQEALPLRLRGDKLSSLGRKDIDLFKEVIERPSIKALFAEEKRLKDGCKAVVERLAETPARTLEGIHAKFQDAIKRDGRDRCLDDDIALSAVDDVARLIGEG
jgi:hypothetical protein